jgi:hypothetical protein
MQVDSYLWSRMLIFLIRSQKWQLLTPYMYCYFWSKLAPNIVFLLLKISPKLPKIVLMICVRTCVIFVWCLHTYLIVNVGFVTPHQGVSCYEFIQIEHDAQVCCEFKKIKCQKIFEQQKKHFENALLPFRLCCYAQVSPVLERPVVVLRPHREW